MSASVIAAQLYTLREFCKTPADIAKTLKKVKQIGYDAVQVSGVGKIDPKELASMLRGEGLTCCITHLGLDRMKNEVQQVIEEHKMWGCQYTAIGGFFKNEFTTQEWYDFAKMYNELAQQYAAAGMSLGYHNHSHEYAKYDGKTAMQILMENCSRDVFFEIDTFWVAHGGADPAQWIRKAFGRIPCVHFKDGYVFNKQLTMCEVGEGNLNWCEILQACREAGVQWYIVEQDVCQRDPFESLAISLRNLKAMGLK